MILVNALVKCCVFILVFDLAYPSVDGIGLYVFGNTAGLAWELPSKPVFLDKKFQKKEEPEPTTTMLPHLEHPVEYEHDGKYYFSYMKRKWYGKYFKAIVFLLLFLSLVT